MHERRALARARVESHTGSGGRAQRHAREAGQAEAPSVERRDRVDAQSVECVRASLEERQHVGMAAGTFRQEVGVAHPREARLLRAVVEPGEVVGGFLDEAPDVAPGCLRQRGLGEERRPRVGLAFAGRTQQPVGSERRAIEEDSRAHAEPGVKVTLDHALPARDVHTQLGHQGARGSTVRRWAVDGERAAVADQSALTDLELVAPRVAAEIVVVVEDEDARGEAGRLAEVPGRGQSADAGAHDHEIVGLAVVGGLAHGLPERPVPQRVGDLERAFVAAAQARERGRVRRRAARRVVEAQPERLVRRQQHPADAERDAVQEVPPRDAAAHPEPLARHKSDPVFLDTVWTTMTAAKEAGHEGQGAEADHDSWQ